jgi:hypothetical protein
MSGNDNVTRIEAKQRSREEALNRITARLDDKDSEVKGLFANDAEFDKRTTVLLDMVNKMQKEIDILKGKPVLFLPGQGIN